MSLNPFLAKGKDAAAALHRVVCILLEGISLYSFRYDRPEATAFQGDLRNIRTRFAEMQESDGEKATLLCSDAVACLERYGAATEKFVTDRTRQMQAVIALFTESMLKVSKGTTDSVVALRKVGDELRQLSDGDDLLALTGKLESCLAAICRETERHESTRNRTGNEPTQTVPEPAFRTTDMATGLPEASEATEMITSVIESGESASVFAFAVEHIEAINQRFGFKVGDDVLVTFAQHLAQSLKAGEVLFRWRGPAFVAVSGRGVSDSTTAGDAAQIAGTKMKFSLTIRDRDIVLPISCSWNMVSISPTTSLAGVIGELDAFVAQRRQSSSQEPGRK